MATKSKDEGITMADVAALNGPTTAPDEAPVEPVDASAPIEVRYEDGGEGVPFLSEGARHDVLAGLDVRDPNNGRKIVRA